MSPASCSLDHNQQISGPSGGGKLCKCIAFTGEQETAVNPIHVYLYVCAYHSDDAGGTRKSFHLPFITSIQSLFIPCPACSDFFSNIYIYISLPICSLQPIHLSSTDVSLQDEKSQTLTSHVWIEMVREASVLRSGAGCSSDDLHPLFCLVLFFCFFISSSPSFGSTSSSCGSPSSFAAFPLCKSRRPCCGFRTSASRRSTSPCLCVRGWRPTV